MTRFPGFGAAAPDIARLLQEGDLRSLIHHLHNSDPQVQWRAAEALGSCGEKAVPLLLVSLKSGTVPVRIGVIEALGMIRDPGAVQPLIAVLNHDSSIEVRWAAALVLGEIGSPDAIPSLVPVLRDPSRYVRYGAAMALGKLGWQPETEPDSIYLMIARQEWDAVRSQGAAATPFLLDMLKDTDPATRERIASVLGQTVNPHTQAACQTVLKDQDPKVRWKAVLASMDCGLAPHNLPIMVAARKKAGPNAAAAGLLNFLFLGQGYNYLGKWWGSPVFMTYVSVMVLAQLAMGPFLPYLIAYPITAIIGIHTYITTERMSSL